MVTAALGGSLFIPNKTTETSGQQAYQADERGAEKKLPQAGFNSKAGPQGECQCHVSVRVGRCTVAEEVLPVLLVLVVNLQSHYSLHVALLNIAYL